MTGIAAPSAPFNELKLIIEPVDPKQLLRIAWRDPASHLRFRRDAAYRFDAPDNSFGVLYAAFDLETAFAETVLRDRPMRAGAASIPLDYAELEERVVVSLEGQGRANALQLIKLYDEGLVAARTDNSISSADDYALTQRWAQAFHEHPAQADGIVYMSRYLGARRSVALFERAATRIAIGAVMPILDHPELARILDLFSVAIEHGH
jgi:hypothetical protein